MLLTKASKMWNKISVFLNSDPPCWSNISQHVSDPDSQHLGASHYLGAPPTPGQDGNQGTLVQAPPASV